MNTKWKEKTEEGTIICQLLEILGITQNEMAKDLYISEDTFSRKTLIGHKNHNFTEDELNKICDICYVSRVIFENKELRKYIFNLLKNRETLISKYFNLIDNDFFKLKAQPDSEINSLDERIKLSIEYESNVFNSATQFKNLMNLLINNFDNYPFEIASRSYLILFCRLINIVCPKLNGIKNIKINIFDLIKATRNLIKHEKLDFTGISIYEDYINKCYIEIQKSNNSKMILFSTLMMNALGYLNVIDYKYLEADEILEIVENLAGKEIFSNMAIDMFTVANN